MFLNIFWQKLIKYSLIVTFCFSLLTFFPLFAMADVNNDRYDGNIYVVYAGNGSLVPPHFTLSQSLERKTPTVLVYYLDDSSDCKQFAIIVSRIQEFYGKAASLIPVNVDTIPLKDKYNKNETGYYYQGAVPQTVILDEEGQIVFNEKGQIPYESIDDSLRKVFDLLPREESVTLKRRSFNEFNTELVQE